MKLYKWTIYLDSRFPFIHIFENNYDLNKQIKKAIKSIKSGKDEEIMLKLDDSKFQNLKTYLETHENVDESKNHWKNDEYRDKCVKNLIEHNPKILKQDVYDTIEQLLIDGVKVSTISEMCGCSITPIYRIKNKLKHEGVL